VGEEAKKILDEKPRLAEVVLEQRLKPQEVTGQLQVASTLTFLNSQPCQPSGNAPRP